ncbi:LuxR C-terminal-related transcriptional regulator (plasmid) [Streptomyces sp. Qhu-G9]|uniref:helix-turn-helix transcriptional regulator n=1 Tax=Streptomyces sp. Qhu-G9 TaxID=3452799 RepID=UPI0022ABF97B|nr:LuxR family transcriptional regulator [Streptomyces aurantiacus]WAU78453.1 LuxR C-terminal-related transcriptional regulator [Streptomyces aurantiacus]
MGREQEGEELRARLAFAERQEPQLVLVSGEAGIGKTALVRRFLCGQDGVRVLWAAGEENERSLPYGVLAQLTDGKGAYRDPFAAGAELLDLLGAADGDCRALAVVVDDVHWADTPSLHALAFALRRLRVDRVLTVLLTRDPDDARLPAGLHRLCDDDQTLRIALEGLTADQIGALGLALGAAPLTRGAVLRLRDHTGGVPLHVRALVRQVPAELLAGAGPLPIPRGHQLLVGSALAKCSARARRFVQAGSVLGVAFPIRAAAVAGEVDEALAALTEAVRAGLLEEESVGGNARARFPHPLLRAAVYQGLEAELRARLHLRAAERADDPGAALEHRACATVGFDGELADQLTELARMSGEDGAWAAAAARLRTAATLTPGRLERERRVLECAESLLLAGDVAQAQAMTDELRRLTDGAGRRYLLGRLALTVGHQDEAARLLSAAWYDRAPHDSPHVAARAAEQLAWLNLIRGDGAEAVTWAARAGDSGTTGPLDVTGLGLALTGRTQDGLAALDRPAPLGGRHPLDGVLARGVLLMWRGELARARTALAEAADGHLHRGGLPGLGILATGFLAEAAYRGGDWDAALAHAHQSLSLAQDTDQQWLMAFAHAMTAGPLAGRGEHDAALAQAEQALRHARALGDASDAAYATTALAQVRAAAGDHAAVVDALYALRGPEFEHRDSIDEPGFFPWPALLAESLARTGRGAEAAEFLVHHERAAAARGGPAARAALARARGAVHTAAGERGAAAAAFRGALELLDGAGHPFEEAQTLFSYGQLLRRDGKRAAAAERFEAARALFGALAALPYAGRCERELAACGARAHTSDGRSSGERAQAVARLTPQELAVARLAAQGLTNRQIARELLLSTKTVEHHLGHAYGKLGIRSRVGLVALLGPA